VLYIHIYFLFLFFSFCFTIVHVHISYHINLLSSILLVISIYRICLRVFCVFSVRLLVCSICNCYFDLIFLQMPRSLTNEQRIFLVKQWWISGNTRVVNEAFQAEFSDTKIPTRQTSSNNLLHLFLMNCLCLWNIIFLLFVKKVNFSLMRSLVILNKEFLWACLYQYKA